MNNYNQYLNNGCQNLDIPPGLSPEEYEQFLGGVGKALGKAAKWVGKNAVGISQTALGVVTGDPKLALSGTANVISTSTQSKSKSSLPVSSVTGVPTAPSVAELEKQKLSNQILSEKYRLQQEQIQKSKEIEKNKDDLLLYGSIGAGGLILVLVLVFAIK